MLAWHVDYWDRLGWKDPFGSEYATERQKRYREALEQKYLVTPQLYADNRPVRGGAIPGVVEEASRRSVDLDAAISPKRESGRVKVKVELTAPDGVELPGLEVRVVLFAKRAVTAVPRGENAGKTLTDVFPVCDVADPVKIVRALRGAFEVRLTPPEGVEPDQIGVAVLAEDAATMTTYACWQADVPVVSRDG